MTRSFDMSPEESWTSSPLVRTRPSSSVVCETAVCSLIDLWRDSQLDSPDLSALVRRIRQLAPNKIIVIKTRVFDVVRAALLDEGMPLVDERVPFQGSGQQREFERAFARALRRSPAGT